MSRRPSSSHEMWIAKTWMKLLVLTSPIRPSVARAHHIDYHRKHSVSTFNKCLSGCRVKHFQTLQALALALKSSGQIKQYIFLPRKNPLCPTLIVHHITSVQQDYAPQDSKLTSVFKCQLLFEH